MDVPLPVAACTTLLLTSTMLRVQSELFAKTALTCCVWPEDGSKEGCEKEIRVTRLLKSTGTNGETECPVRIVPLFTASPYADWHSVVANSTCVSLPHSQVLRL